MSPFTSSRQRVPLIRAGGKQLNILESVFNFSSISSGFSSVVECNCGGCEVGDGCVLGRGGSGVDCTCAGGEPTIGGTCGAGGADVN